MNRSLFLIVLGVMASMSLMAQTYENTGKGIKTTLNAVELEIKFFNPSTVRIVKFPQGWQYTKESLSVVETPQQVNIKTSQKGDVVSLKSNKMEVRLDLKTGNVSYYTLAGNLLLQEKNGLKFTDFNDAGVKTFSVYQPFVLDGAGILINGGQNKN